MMGKLFNEKVHENWQSGIAVLDIYPRQRSDKRWLLLIANFNIQMPDAPFQRFLVGVEEYVKSISANDSASVEYFYVLAVLVARDSHFGSKWVCFIRGYKSVALRYFMTRCGYTV